MIARQIVATGALLGAVAVVVGAFGAHGLRGRVSPDMLKVFETGVRYHFYHALAIVVLGAVAASAVVTSGRLEAAVWSFVAGIVIFSGSLYLLVLTDTRWLGAITPIGGLAFILGWLLLAWAAWAE
jgi:uncharacterized membrane protein YgdD (TMEM256/DUF423 family)